MKKPVPRWRAPITSAGASEDGREDGLKLDYSPGRSGGENRSKL